MLASLLHLLASLLYLLASLRYLLVYHRERILETSTLSCNEEEEDITKPPKR